jgi:hypothetical protein
MRDFKVIFKRSFLYPLVNALLILALLLLVSACDTNNSTTPTNSSTPSTTNPPGNILEFEDFFMYMTWKTPDIPTQVYVMTSKDSPPPPVIAFEDEEYLPEVEDVDFSQYFILFTFMGLQSVTGPTIKVTQIWQIDNDIFIEAFFDQGGPTYQPAWSSPCDIVKVSKENMTQFGEITFILLDQYGEERARAVYSISQ